jgi:hypothetical protein
VVFNAEGSGAISKHSTEESFPFLPLRLRSRRKMEWPLAVAEPPSERPENALRD